MKAQFHVCADFHDKNGNVIYRVRADSLNKNQYDVPEAIQQDILFTMLVNDGSIEVLDSEERKKAVENDPLKGIGADGKKIEAKPAKVTK